VPVVVLGAMLSNLGLVLDAASEDVAPDAAACGGAIAAGCAATAVVGGVLGVGVALGDGATGDGAMLGVGPTEPAPPGTSAAGAASELGTGAGGGGGGGGGGGAVLVAAALGTLPGSGPGSALPARWGHAQARALPPETASRSAS